MTLTRKMLKAMGIEEEKIDEIIDAHTETVDGLKQEIENARAEAKKLPGVQKKLEEMQKAAEENEGKNPWKLKYDALKDEYGKYRSEVTEENTKREKVKALRELLRKIGIAEKRIDAVVRVTDVNELELEDGKIKDEGGKIAKSLKEEWSDFIVTQGAKAEVPATPPQGTGGKMSKEEIFKIKDSAERQKAIAENHELFGF